MFGYVKPSKPDLLMRDYEFYRRTYCGVCRALKSETGAFSHAFLTYDSVYLALIRMLYIPDGAFGVRKVHCAVRPVRGCYALKPNDALTYTARAFMCLSYHKLLDDLHDEPAAKRAAIVPIRPVMARARKRADLPELDRIITEELAAISRLERENSPSVDEGGEHFGALLGRVFSEGLTGADARITHEIGFHLGKFIYAADAAEDYEKDKKHGVYNPFVALYGGDTLTKESKTAIHTGLLLEAEAIGRAVELLPFGSRQTIARLVRNITYDGLKARVDFLIKEDESVERSL
ncbi:MAG: DUF5685 family protein [Clostridia bacterium]|nr:DUF5685 family protein [Clostridia bacterium]